MMANSDGDDSQQSGRTAEERPVIEAPDELHRRLRWAGPDGRTIEVLAARRGVAMRPGSSAVAGGGGDLNPVGLIVDFVASLVLSVVLSAVIDGAAENRPWKIKAYRLHGPLARRIHSEVLPSGTEPEGRMHEVLAELTG